MPLEQQPIEPLAAQLEAAPRVAELLETVALENADRVRAVLARAGNAAVFDLTAASFAQAGGWTGRVHFSTIAASASRVNGFGR